MKNANQAILFLLLFFLAEVSIQAKNIYLSSTGSDNNNGLTESTSVKTLSKALSLSSDNDHIILADIIDITTEPGNTGHGITFPNKSLTIQGSDKQTSGFDGKNQSQIVRLDGISSIISFKNLTFKNASGNNGNAIAITRGSLTVNNCIFADNDASIINNSKGGAISANPIQDISLRISQSLFRNNKVGQKGGCIYMINNASGKTITTHIESCAFINNIAPESGAGIIFDKSPNPIIATIVNCTFYGNTSLNGEGPAILLGNGNENSRFDLINCTATQNECKYNGAIRFTRETQPSQKNIHNCIFENNTNANGYRDGAWQTSAELNSTNRLTITNSFIGQTDLNKVDYPGNYLNYYLGSTTSEAYFTEYNESGAYIPVSNLSEATTFGDSHYLQTLGIITDQIGTPRQYKDSKCTIGAIEIEPALESEKEVYQHFIIYGQSFSVGSQSYPPLSTEPIEGNYMIGNQLWMNNGQSAQDRTTFTPLIAKVPADHSKPSNTTPYKNTRIGQGECPLIGAVNHIQLKTKDTEHQTNILATSCGIGGASIEQLSKEVETGNNFYRMLFTEALDAAYKIAHRARNIKLVCPAIFWLQGETNQNPEWGISTKEGYKALLVQLKNDMQQDIMMKYGQTRKPAFITYQTSGDYLQGSQDMPISMAQLEASNEYDDIISAGPVYPVTHSIGGHLNANGYRWYGEMMGKVYYKTQILGEDFKPLQPIALHKTGNTKELKIKFHVPVPPLVFDEHIVIKKENYGFDVQINQVAVAITNTRIENDCVILTLANDIQASDNLEVIYAGVKKKFGNLRDSDPYKAYFNYENLDKKKEDGSFYYERDEDVSSLITTINPEPKDENGSIIYDTPYPLYNFCVAFNKKVKADELTEEIGTTVDGNTKPSPRIYIAGEELILEVISGTITTIGIFDLSGYKISDTIAKCDTNKYDLSFLANGIYILKVIINNDNYTLKIVKN